MNLKQLNELLMEKKSRTFSNLIKHAKSIVSSLEQAELLANGAKNRTIDRSLANQIKKYKYHIHTGHMDIQIDDDVVTVTTDVRVYSENDEHVDRTMTIKLRNGKLFQTEIKK